MNRRGYIEDPLEEIDPVMEQAYSVGDSDDIEEPAPMAAPPEPEPVMMEQEIPVVGERVPVGEIKKSFHVSEEDDLNLYRDQDDNVPVVSNIEFPNLDEAASGKKVELDVFKNIPVNLSVELGRAKISLKEVFELTEGSIIELERLVGEPLDLVVNGQLIAQGEVVAIDNNYGLRVTNIISKPQR
ncbi:MAG: flagellar motor switch protein FliN/FliY [Candidatus Marinamargulisbacteria bacterium]|jgi:flagellar motor switch protein FliN/FliY